MRTLALMQPPRIVIGEQAAETCVAEALRQGRRRIFVVTSPPLLTLVEPVAAAFRQAGAEVVIHDAIAAEPTVRMLDTALADRAVADCIVNKLRVLKMPPARAASTAWLELRVGPGDEPLPPPEELIVPGDGMLAVAALREGLRAGLPRIEACYRTAFAYAPSLWGRMLLRFHLTDRGKLDEVFEAGTQFPDPRVSQCVVHEARKLKFPKPAFGDIRFVVGLRFQSDRSKHELPPAPIPATQKRNGQE